MSVIELNAETVRHVWKEVTCHRTVKMNERSTYLENCSPYMKTGRLYVMSDCHED